MSHMFRNASSFNQDISKWVVSSVYHMSSMFQGASSFNKDVSSWDVCMVEATTLMMSGTKVEAELVKYCACNSFFDDNCRGMSPTERQEFFSIAFPWRRRKFFLLFLVCQGYMYVSSVTAVGSKRPQKHSCDILFDVEDLHRETCKFL